jgi:hypothetical protein
VFLCTAHFESFVRRTKLIKALLARSCIAANIGAFFSVPSVSSVVNLLRSVAAEGRGVSSVVKDLRSFLDPIVKPLDGKSALG